MRMDLEHRKRVIDFINTQMARGAYGTRTMSIGYREKKGELTMEPCIKFGVPKKLPKSQVSDPVPSQILIDGVIYPTDVVEVSTIPIPWATLCRTPAEIQQHSNQYRPLVGGINMGSNKYAFGGTLGGIMVDNRDGKLVGVTNNHVIVPGSAEPLWHPNDHQTIFWDPVAPTNNDSGVGRGDIYVLQQGGLIGTPKRAVPYKLTNNTVDGMVFNLRSTVAGNVSWKPLGAPFNTPPRAASSSEINSLGPGNPLFISGASSGYRGGDEVGCQIRFVSTSSSSPAGTRPYTSIWYDLVEFVSTTDSVVGQPGDSGSFIYAKLFSGEWVIAGILFAGLRDGTRGWGCRIDNLMAALEVSAWTDANYLATSWNNASFIDIPQSNPYYGNSWIIDGDGKKYWYAGLVKSSKSAAVTTAYNSTVQLLPS